MNSIITISDMVILKALFYDLFMKYLLKNYCTLGTKQTKISALKITYFEMGEGSRQSLYNRNN